MNTQTAQVSSVAETEYDIVIVGAGGAGIATAASILKRCSTQSISLSIALIDPAEMHYYQPGWTMVGAGIFSADSTSRTMASRIPDGVKWIKAGVAAFEPDRNAVVLDNGQVAKYKQLVVCPGLKLDWNGIAGLPEALGKNGVTSNYRFDLAPYTWELVQKLHGGKAIFTQPAMPIKCAGAPQKAMYLSADYWRSTGVLPQINIEFCNAGPVLFGVAAYVPALMEYIKAYGIDLQFGSNLVAIDGAAKLATFTRTNSEGTVEKITREYDMIHVVPPQIAPDFIRSSPLAEGTWVTVDPASMRHTKFANVYALGDVANTTNAKTAAAARMQAPVVAHNVLAGLGKLKGESHYNGYGSCPLTVERGKIVLAEFLYGGKVAPSFPSWLIDGTKPSALAWFLKAKVLPALYWQGMLKGRELLFHPDIVEK
jgi:sulfide:quinone oxidoreductase